MQKIDPSAVISPTAKLGVRYRPLLNKERYETAQPLQVGRAAFIGEYVVVGLGVSIGDHCLVDHHCIIEQDVSIGPNTLLCYRAQICAESRIENGCVIGGFVAERSTVKSGTRMLGSLVHSHGSTSGGWDDDASMEPGPTIGACSFIAFGAVIVGAVSIGDGCYVGANSVVRCNLPQGARVGPGEVRVER